MSEVFPNAPLVEAVFALQFAGEALIEVVRPKIQEAVRHELPKLFVPRAVADVAPALQPYEFRSDDQTEIVAVAINRFSYHTRKYGGFELFRTRFQHFYGVFAEHIRLHRLNRVGLRYINHIPVLRPSEGAPIPLADYLRVGIQTPDSIPAELSELNCAFTVRVGRSDRLHIKLQYKQLDGPAQREILVLDFDFAQTEDLDAANLDTYLDKAHEYTKRVFLDLVSPKYLPLMKGENP